jgi:transposase
MGIIAPTWGEAVAFGFLPAACALNEGGGGKRSRRAWSSEEKQRIVAEAMRPGASVAEIARRHGLNANLVFAWRRMLQPAPTQTADVALRTLPPGANASPAPVGSAEFVPIGVFTRSDDNGPALQGQAASVAIAAAAPGRSGVTRPAMDERPGVIEIVLADGTRLRVDAFVNERALRRVLAALKAAS